MSTALHFRAPPGPLHTRRRTRTPPPPGPVSSPLTAPTHAWSPPCRLSALIAFPSDFCGHILDPFQAGYPLCPVSPVCRCPPPVPSFPEARVGLSRLGAASHPVPTSAHSPPCSPLVSPGRWMPLPALRLCDLVPSEGLGALAPGPSHPLPRGAAHHSGHPLHHGVLCRPLTLNHSAQPSLPSCLPIPPLLRVGGVGSWLLTSWVYGVCVPGTECVASLPTARPSGSSGSPLSCSPVPRGSWGQDLWRFAT